MRGNGCENAEMPSFAGKGRTRLFMARLSYGGCVLAQPHADEGRIDAVTSQMSHAELRLPGI